MDFYKFDGANAAIVRGSALKALEGDDGKYGKKSVLALLDAVDEHIPIPPRDLEKSFLMPVEDVFSIAGRGTVATGRIESGVCARVPELHWPSALPTTFSAAAVAKPLDV